jgi:cytochrome b
MPNPPTPAMPATARGSADAQLVWDLPLRVCHWALALAVTGSFVSHYADAFEWHVRFGYLTLVLVAFRIAWGFLGPRDARFAELLGSARAAWSRRAVTRGAGHTALGAWMALLLLTLLGGQALTGLFANDEVVDAGPLSGWVRHATSSWLSAWHENISNALLGAIVLHLLAAAYYRWRLGDDRIVPLVTGRKRGLQAGSAIEAEHVGRAVLVLLAVAATLALIVWLAPPPADASG